MEPFAFLKHPIVVLAIEKRPCVPFEGDAGVWDVAVGQRAAFSPGQHPPRSALKLIGIHLQGIGELQDNIVTNRDQASRGSLRAQVQDLSDAPKCSIERGSCSIGIHVGPKKIWKALARM